MEISEKLKAWYDIYKRDLPWRNTKEPYKIWLSEIILQQTQVKQGLPYYINFITKFPKVSDLANASEQEVLKTWQGLGYYSRARNLHATAKLIQSEFNQEFPKTYNDLIKLKGVGPYTAAAISSICFNEKQAVVDGNVYRVLSRLYNNNTPINTNEGQKLFKQFASDLITEKEPDKHNQAIMELGATVCKPKQPDCLNCPLQADCLAFNKKTVNALPVKLKKIKIKSRYFNYIVFQDNKSTIIEKRTKKDIWQGLFQFPLIETSEKISVDTCVDLIKKQFPNQTITLANQHHYTKHILSHQHIYSSFWVIQTDLTNHQNNKIQNQVIKDFPVSRNIDRFLNEQFIFL